MTCSEVRETLSTVALRDLRDAESQEGADAELLARVRAHVAVCQLCAHVTTLIAEAEAALNSALAGAVPIDSSTTVSEHAWATAHRLRYRRWVSVGAAAGVIAMLTGIVAVIAPEVRRLTSAPPPVVTATFTLQCLSPNQAASLVLPYIPRPENPRWQAERFGVDPADAAVSAITVRAPQQVIDRVPAILAPFERRGLRGCEVPRSR